MPLNVKERTPYTIDMRFDVQGIPADGRITLGATLVMRSNLLDLRSASRGVRFDLHDQPSAFLDGSPDGQDRGPAALT